MRTRLTALSDDMDVAKGALTHIATNMREWDRREIFATRWDDDPAGLVGACLLCPRTGWVAWRGEAPVAAIGAVPICPGVWSMWCFGTDDFPQIGLGLTKHATRFIIPMIARSGHRAEALSMDGHDEAHRWLEGFGMFREATHHGRGRSGETFHTYATRYDDVRWRRGRGHGGG